MKLYNFLISNSKLFKFSVIFKWNLYVSTYLYNIKIGQENWGENRNLF